MKKLISTLCPIILLIGCGDDVPTEPESGGAASAYFSQPIEVSGKFQKGATFVVSVSGEVSILESAAPDSNQSAKPAPSVERAAKANDVLSPGDQVRTGAGSEALLLFSNGSTVTVGPGTQVRIDRFVQEEFEGSDQKVGSLAAEVSSSRMKLDLEIGELVIGVKKLNKESSLIISTSMGLAGVRGTHFKVTANKDQTSVSVLSGSVDFKGLNNETRTIAKETKLEVFDGTLAEGAIPAADKARIEAAQQVAKQKTADFSLGKLSEAFDEVNPKQANRLQGGNLWILIHVEDSGALLETHRTLQKMRNTVMKKALLPFYRNDENLYNQRVQVVHPTKGARTLQFFSDVTKKENVLAVVFQDEAEPVYHLPNSNEKPQEKYLEDLASLKAGLSDHSGVYRGIMFQVDRGQTHAKVFKEFVEKALRGECYLSGHNLKDYYWQENKDNVLNRTGVVFGDGYQVKDKGDPQYYFDLIIEAAKKTGLDLQKLHHKSSLDINSPRGKAGIRG